MSALLKGTIQSVKIGLRVVPLQSYFFGSFCTICCKIFILILEFLKGIQFLNLLFKSFKIFRGPLIWNFFLLAGTHFWCKIGPSASRNELSFKLFWEIFNCLLNVAFLETILSEKSSICALTVQEVFSRIKDF
jgi:hypothetical protein